MAVVRRLRLRGESGIVTQITSCFGCEMLNCVCLQVVAESEQIRREVDNSGPRDELDFWKRRVSRFNYVLNQIKSAHVKAALNVLSVSKSKLLKVN